MSSRVRQPVVIRRRALLRAAAIRGRAYYLSAGAGGLAERALTRRASSRAG
jgi:hypothetical protein